jgi:hypothetical protein
METQLCDFFSIAELNNVAFNNINTERFAMEKQQCVIFLL